MCVFTLSSSQKQCYPFPDTFKGYPYELVWSPDSAYVTFTEDPQQSANESDIWTFNAADGAFTDRTNDGVEGPYRGKNVEGKTFWLDYLPMWNTDDGLIYFWRSVPWGDYAFTLELWRINGASGEPEKVRDLSEFFKNYMLLYDGQEFLPRRRLDYHARRQQGGHGPAGPHGSADPAQERRLGGRFERPECRAQAAREQHGHAAGHSVVVVGARFRQRPGLVGRLQGRHRLRLQPGRADPAQPGLLYRRGQRQHEGALRLQAERRELVSTPS